MGVQMKKIIVGISGATGSIYGIRTLEILRSIPDVETHLVLTDAAVKTIYEETEWEENNVKKLANFTYDIQDIGARIASGSFITEGMIIAPCSIKSMAMISNSINSNLLIRAADVILKEKRKLVLLVRETPFHLGHLRLLTNLAEIGACIYPPIPAFYLKPKNLDDMIRNTVGRALDMFGIQHKLYEQWNGMKKKTANVC